ncbi:dopamine beta-hydroxylase-like [Pecten maximus]|uniref:dopamine beta-hydroxylase-like n=1 Tax=Pecten maximus TaxID=6579 RepID=UPI001458CE31|nr:dopamine beta-hydroxylase-like [Pecten maximus]
MKTMKALLGTLVLTVIVSPWRAYGYSSFQARIPNGDRVRDPCDGVAIWQGVGHQGMGGGGPRNPFGLDFYNNGMVWNSTICQMDSDGDGTSNGAELGDPNCEWTPGSNPTDEQTGHPGLCEPWSDPKCLEKNSFHKCQTAELECDAISKPDVLDFAVRFPKTKVPSEETTYMCMNFAFPADQDYHVIADRGLIDNNFVMHHIVTYACSPEVELDDLVNPLNTPYVCGMAGEERCQEIISLWSVGIPGFCHNENAGFKIGPNGYKYASMQMHWNNPLGKENYTDSSGMTLFYTPVLRPYNLGNLLIGENLFQIPPGETRYVVDSECSSICSAQFMNDTINVISGMNHMHYMGRQMTTYLTPAGGDMQAIMHDEQYSYDNPMVYTFQTPLQVRPGDVLKTRCSFTSSHKVVTTTSGEATSQEMCYAFLFYYPKESFQSQQCVTTMGLPRCLLDHPTELIDGCQMPSFINNQTMFLQIFTELSARCEAFTCRKECKTYIKDLRQHECMQGRVGDYVDRLLDIYVGVDQMVLYHSCDVEIEREAAEPCTCTTQAPGPCVEYTGTAAYHQMSLYLLLVTMAAIYSK